MEDMLYSTVNYNKMQVKNRLVRSATFEMATMPDGGLTEEYLSIHQSLAKGGIGMLITGITGISKEGRLMPSMPYTTHPTFEKMLYHDAQNMELEGVKLIVQLCSGGVLASSECGEVLAPSSIKNAKEMNSDQIETLIEQYVEAAKSCERAGAHGVQIHAAHGLILSQFLSPHFNHRTDEYGGNISNRAKVLCRVITAIKAAVSKDFAVLVKLNKEDELSDGMTSDEALEVAKLLENCNVDGIEISCGMIGRKDGAPNRTNITKENEGYNFKIASCIANTVQVPVFVVGGFRTYSEMEYRLKNSNIVGISLSRPLICEPDLPNKWFSDRSYQPKCKSCNKCFMSSPLRCKLYETT
jgi:2,4-dienoyl-CoA reductase-like NADH-dependent reductase (Old Yellow Enzyme family)